MGSGTGEGEKNTHLEELNALLAAFGARVGDTQHSKLSPEQVGAVLLCRGHIKAEHIGGDTFWTNAQLI